jgi:hypothetical protein
MTTKNNRRALAQAEEDVCFYYSPDVLPQMQSLLAALAGCRSGSGWKMRAA